MLLSIITVNLNNLSGLKKTAESILSQTCKDYEWIVIDGGSTDGSKEYIESISEHISYWVSEKDNGIYDAMNKGIDVAKGHYLHFLNSGDYYTNENIIRLLKKANYIEDVIYGDVQFVTSESKITGSKKYPDSFGLLYIVQNNFCHQSFFYSRKCFDHKRYSTDYQFCSDLELNLFLYLNCFTFKKFNEFVVNYDTEGYSSKNEYLCLAEIKRCKNECIPISLKEDLLKLSKYHNTDIGSKTEDIIESNKFFRHLLRIYLYPLHGLCLLYGFLKSHKH